MCYYLQQKAKIDFIYEKSLENIEVTRIEYNGDIDKTLEITLLGTPISFRKVKSIIVLTRVTEEEKADAEFTGKVTGQVLDEDGFPATGAFVKGRNYHEAVITDSVGRYSIKVLPETERLTFSYLGCSNRIVNILNRNQINVRMERSATNLNEVVVVGYGVKSRSDLSGAVSSLGEDVFANRGAIESPLQAIQGEIAGVTISRQTGAPGRDNNYDLEIRGLSSINGSAPLIVIDGLPLSDNKVLSSINPSDIESFTVLKDASAAIFGARAAGGVILVTTKQGASEKPLLQYTGSFSFNSPGIMPEFMNMQHYMETFEEAFLNDGQTLPLYPDQVVQMFRNPDKRPASGWIANNFTSDYYDFTFFNTDWNKVLYGNSVSNRQNLSISGMAAQLKYLISLGYTDNNSTLRCVVDQQKKYNLRVNFAYNISENFKLESWISFENSALQSPSNSVNIDMGQPGFPTSSIDGKPYAWGAQFTPNWVALLGGEKHTDRNRLNMTFNMGYTLSPHLQLQGSVGINYGVGERLEWYNTIDWYDYAGGGQTDGTTSTLRVTYPSKSSIYRYTDHSLYQNYSTQLNYNALIDKIHKWQLMTGISYETNQNTNLVAYREDLILQEIHILGIGALQGQYASDELREWAIASLYSRMNYAYKNKYLLDLNLRESGSSRFAANNRWGLFYGLSGAWRITEDFFKNQKWINSMKLRASWGKLGNQNGIDEYGYLQYMKVNNPKGIKNGNNPIFGSPISPVIAQTVTADGIAGPWRTWEEITTSNVGYDLSLWKGKLSLTADCYVKINHNMLIELPNPALLGGKASKSNSGRLRTNGWELSAEWQNSFGKLNTYIRANVSDNQNKMIDLGGQSAYVVGRNYIVENYPMNSYFGYIYTGLIKTQTQLAEYLKLAEDSRSIIPKSKLRIGDAMFKDVNKDGVLDDRDAVFLGNDQNRYSFSFTVGGSWKGFDFKALFQGVGKRTIMRENYLRSPMYAWWLGQNEAWYGKTYSDFYQRYDASLPKLTVDEDLQDYDYICSTLTLQNAAYLRGKNLEIGYSIPKNHLRKLLISNARLFVSGTDLFEFQIIKDGYDPETQYNAEKDARHPFNRGISVGADLTF